MLCARRSSGLLPAELKKLASLPGTGDAHPPVPGLQPCSFTKASEASRLACVSGLHWKSPLPFSQGQILVLEIGCSPGLEPSVL